MNIRFRWLTLVAVCLAPLAFSSGVLLASELNAEPNAIEIRYSVSYDYVTDLSTAIYRQTHNPKFLPPDPQPGLIWEPRAATIIEEFTGVKRPDGAQVFVIPHAHTSTLVVQGDSNWQKFILSLHKRLGMKLTLE